MNTFTERLITWQRASGRHHLPWQDRDPYHVWLSEIMLQQTQVTSVIPYYHRFLERFPTVCALAEASQDEVLSLWSGLGYYARARNLHKSAQQICDDYSGKFPQQRQLLESLKGVGRSTAAAISVFAYGKKEAICDGNVKRLLARHQGIFSDFSTKKAQQELWKICEQLLPETREDLCSYTQGLMDFGSSICSRGKPKCQDCPLKEDCYAYQHQEQTNLPIKKQKKTKPIKDGWFLLVCNPQKKVYLEKREEKGIWGGLWSLPWFESKADLLAACHSYHLAPQKNHRDLLDEDIPILIHKFTHYTLNMHLITAYTHDKKTPNFYAADEYANLGLPSPIKLLLKNTTKQFLPIKKPTHCS